MTNAIFFHPETSQGSRLWSRPVSIAVIPGIRMVQQPVRELQQLRGPRRRLAAQPIAEGSTSLARQGIAGTALEIVAEFEVGTAAELGLKVRTGEQEETVIGIDPRAGQLFVDPTRVFDDEVISCGTPHSNPVHTCAPEQFEAAAA